MTRSIEGTRKRDGGRVDTLYSDRRMKRDWPFYWISLVNTLYSDELGERLKPLGLDVARWRVLMSLYEVEHLSISEISDYALIKLNTATKIVQRMVTDGLIETRVRPTDGRVTEVRLTPKGDGVRRKARAEADGILDASFVGFSQDEVKKINELLERVHDRLQEVRRGGTSGR